MASDSDQQIDDQAPDRAIIQWPAGSDGDETLPLEATPDISPHDSFLRQACEKMIALTKEDVIANNGVLTKKQLDRLNAIHDLMVDMVEDMRKG